MADFEKIEIDPETAEARFEKSDFAQVVFHNILETYVTDSNLECAYTITPSLVPSAKDWIGLYRVGWKSSNDYVCFQWSPVPENITSSEPVENQVVFQANSLPKEDGDFYQFCYVASGNQVRGASTPFQFKGPCADDFVEVEDEEDDMMVIKTKTILLEDNLTAAKKEKEDLQKRMTLLEQERDSLLDKLVDYNKMLHGERIEREQLQKQLKVSAEKLTCIESEVKDVALLNDGLREKITFLTQEKESILKRLDENERYISSLQEKIKALINEKDALTGKVKSLEQEKELFKSHFTSSEGTIQGYMKEVDKIKVQLKVQEESSAQHAAQSSKLKTELSEMNKKLERQLTISKADKDHLDALREKLRNAEDKLGAAEHCKTLLNDEVTAVQQAHQKMSQDLEKSKMECDTWCQRLMSMEAKQTESEKVWNQEKIHLQKQLEQKETEIGHELNQIREQLRTSEERHNADKDGSLFALQTAQAHLKERYARMRKENDELQKQLADYSQKQKKWEACERDLHREIEDLKERLSMGAEEYKYKYLECRKLQTEIKKLQRQLRKSHSPEKSLESSSTETDRVRRMSVGSGTDRVERTSVGSATDLVMSSSVGSGTDRVQRSSVASETEKVTNNSVAMETERVTNASVAMETDKVTNAHVAMETERVVNSSVGSETEKVMTAEVDTNTREEEKFQVCSQTEEWERQSSIADLTNTELQAQLEDLGKELDKRYNKKQKYKQMYLDEKDRSTFLQKHYFEELLAKDAQIEGKNKEIEKLRKVIRSFRVEYRKLPSKPEELETQRKRMDFVEELDPLLAEEEPPKTLEEPLTPLPAPIMPEVLPSAKVAAVKAVVTPPVRGDEIHDEDLMQRSSVITAQPRASGAPTPSAPEAEENEDERHKVQASVDNQSPNSRFMDADGEPQMREPEFHDASGGDEDGAVGGLVTDGAPIPQPRSTPATAPPTEPQFHDADGDPQKLCPVCNTTFPADLPQHMFEEHVDSHYGPICPLCNQHFGSEHDQAEFENHVHSHFEQE